LCDVDVERELFIFVNVKYTLLSEAPATYNSSRSFNIWNLVLAAAVDKSVVQ
jgi:hypothetical protein